MKKICKFPWVKLSSRKIYQNHWLKLREDRIIRPTGERGIYSVVEISPAVGIVVITKNKKIILLRHWRYPARKQSIEIPLGGVERGESPLHAAKRELLEETGYQSKKWKLLGTFESSNCMTTDTANVFLARDAYPKSVDIQEEQLAEGIEVIAITRDKAIQWVRRNKITESISKGALLII